MDDNRIRCYNNYGVFTADLIYCYKIVFGLTDLPLSDYFQMAAEY